MTITDREEATVSVQLALSRVEVEDDRANETGGTDIGEEMVALDDAPPILGIDELDGEEELEDELDAFLLR